MDQRPSAPIREPDARSPNEGWSIQHIHHCIVRYQYQYFGPILQRFSMFCNGFIHSAIFTLTAVYAASMNFTIFEISLLIFLISFAGGIFQWPIGFFSDKSDRRMIIIFCTFAASIFCILAIRASGTSLENMYLATSVGLDKIMFFIYATLYAGAALPLFTLTLAYINDYIPKEKFVAAGAGLQIIFGIGAMLGPIVCTLLMT